MPTDVQWQIHRIAWKLSRPGAAPPATAPPSPPAPPPPNYDRFDRTLAYMWDEMIKNAQSPEIRDIKADLDAAKRLDGVPHPGGVGTVGEELRIAAVLKFWSLVHPGARWDHKPILEEKLGLRGPDGKKGTKDDDYWFPVRGDTTVEYNYDIWSNIHFGFVGAAAGFDLGTLQTGANLPLIGGTASGDKSDELSVRIGYELWAKHETNLTADQLHQAILDHSKDYEDLWQRGEGQSVTTHRNNR